MRPFLSITFPQGFRISKNIDHPTSGYGGKKTVKRYLKSEQTNRHTNTQTDIWTFRLIESIGPEGRCFEKQVDYNNVGFGWMLSEQCCVKRLSLPVTLSQSGHNN